MVARRQPRTTHHGRNPFPFDLDKVNRRNAIFDLDKCFWLNGQHILAMSLARFSELAKPFVDKAGIAYGTDEALIQALAIVKAKVKHLSDVPDWISFLFRMRFHSIQRP